MGASVPERIGGMFLSTKWLQGALFVASVLFAILVKPLLGWAVAPAVSSVNRATLVVLSLVCVTLLLAMNVALALYAERMKYDERTAKDISTIARSAGLRAMFLHEGNREPGHDAYTIMRELVRDAKSELLILDHRPAMAASRFYDQTPPESASRQAYYDELTTKALSKSADGRYFRYKRIVQLEEGPSATWSTAANQDTCFAAHCRKIVEYRSLTPKAVCSVTTSRVFFPRSSIIIVDGTTVLLELAIVGPAGEARVEGDLLFNDPEGNFAGPLRELFDHIDGQATLVSQVV